MSATATVEDGGAMPDRTVPVVRLAAALVQAASLYLLVWSADAPYTWPATAPRVFVPMLLVTAFVPLIVSVAIGRIPTRSLMIWIAATTVVIAGLGYHDAARGAVPTSPSQVVFWPGFQLGFALCIGVFIAHVLVLDSIIERRWLASYTRYFDAASKLALQGALVGVFVGVFWGLLSLGAGLFKLVGIDLFVAVIQYRWFAYPTTCVAIVVAIHATDIQPALIRGIRSLALTLLSWLLPLLSAILLGFIAVLPFISLTPLWKTHFATGLLLSAAGAVIFLINCCYQDGAAEQVASRIRRFAGTLGAIELVPLVGLAVWGLSLRVGQYGWSTDRILAAAAIAVACCCAIGYAGATLPSRGWLRRVEITNVATAWLVLALILALFSPIADPARLMVADQLARLKSGVIRPDRFDFAALKFDGARWGAAGLAELSRIGEDQPDAAGIRAGAARALALTNRYGPPPLPPLTTEMVARRVEVYPSGRVLPAAFLDAAIWGLQGGGLPTCLQSDTSKCTAFFVTLQPGAPEALVIFGNVGTGIFPVFEQDQGGNWRKTAQALWPMNCAGFRQALEHADVVTKPHAWPDLAVGGQPVIIAPLPGPCDGTASAPTAPLRPSH